ncbi:unnamed protein product [Effrenium voratum]|nr:unnamed protein product [Effrenium voratum]
MKAFRVRVGVHDRIPHVPLQASPSRTHRLLMVFGASGGSGSAVVEAALGRGFRVRAFVRSRERLRVQLGNLIDHEMLEVVEGDLQDPGAVQDAIAGAQAVICSACARPETAPGPVAAAMPAIVSACRKNEVERLVVQSCALAAVPGEWWGLLTPARLARAVVRWQNSSNIIDDAERTMQYLYREAKDVKWVVARAPWLEEGEPLGGVVPNLDPFRASTLRYSDLADWLLDQVQGDAYVGKMPRLRYRPVEHPI